MFGVDPDEGQNENNKLVWLGEAEKGHSHLKIVAHLTKYADKVIKYLLHTGA